MCPQGSFSHSPAIGPPRPPKDALTEGYSSTFDDDSYEMHEKTHPQIEFYALEKEHYHYCLMMTEHVAVLQILVRVRKYLLESV